MAHYIHIEMHSEMDIDCFYFKDILEESLSLVVINFNYCCVDICFNVCSNAVTKVLSYYISFP